MSQNNLIKCPNCEDLVKGLYSNEVYGITHCGCFYDIEPKNITQWIISDVYDEKLEKEFDNERH